MRRLLCLFWLLVALLPVTLVAQESLRARWACRGAGCALAVPAAITIETPTLAQTHQTNEVTLILAGRARNDVTRVDWSNDRGGSGTATGTFPTWTVEAGGGGEPETVLEDTFTVDVATNLVDHTPGPTGLSWAEAEDTLGNNHAKLNTASDYVSPALTTSTGKLIYIATPASAVSGDHYTVSMKTGPNYSVSSGTDSALIFGWVDVSNYCALVIRSSTQNPDLILMKRVAGVNTDLATGVDVTPLANHIFALEVDGASLTVRRNGSTVLSATDGAGACDNSTAVGIGWGDIRTTGRTINQVASFDDFTVVDEESAAAGVALQSGANVIVAIAYCGVTECGGVGNGRDTITVTRGVADTTDPQITITGPTTDPTYASPTAAITVSGIASDNQALDDVTFTCAPGCTPASGTATGTVSWSFAVTITSGQAATIIVTATDTSANDFPDQFIATFDASDTTDPDIDLASPTAGTTYTATTTPTTFSGTASDDTAVASVTCANAAGGGTVLATGTTSWSCAVPLFNGTQTVTFTAFDLAGNDKADTVDVTFSPTITIVSPAALQGAGQSLPYSVTLSVVGGTSPYTWDNNSGGTSLGGAACTGLTISTAGVVSGTPTTTGTCSFTSKVTDSAGSPDSDTQPHTILVSAVATGQHAFFEAARLRSDWVRGYSLRPPGTGHPLSTDPYYDKQLNGNNDGGFHLMGCDPALSDLKFTYNYGADTDPHKQDAAKSAIPSFNRPGNCTGHTLTQALSASTTNATDIISLTDTTATYGPVNQRQIRIDDEVMKFRPCTAAEGGVRTDSYSHWIESQDKLCVLRGQYGTTAAAHSVGTVARLSGNAFVNFLKLPLNTEDGYTYLITWDAYFTDSYLAFKFDQGQKTFQFTKGTGTENKLFEPKVRFDCRNGANVAVAGCGTSHVGAVAARAYNSINAAGITAWSETNGNTLGPNALTTITDMAPQPGNFIIRPNVWTRWWVKVKQQANDFDLFSMWVADENNDPVLIFDSIPFSVSGTLDPTKQRMIEFEIALGNSNSQFLRGWKDNIPGQFFDFVNYFRNWFVLRWTHATEPADLAAEGLMAKPVGSGGGS
jgi:hypothetical protein